MKAPSATASSSSSQPHPATKVNIAIDVSQETLDIAVHETGTHWTCKNRSAALPALIKKLKKLQPERVVFEPSGGYENPVVGKLAAAGLPLARVDAHKVRQFAGATGKRAKTDRIDAFLLARYGAVIQPPITPLKNAEAQALEHLVARRDQLVEMLGSERLRLKQAHRQEWPGALIKDLEGHISELQKRLDQADGELNRMLESSPLWQARDELLRSVPGVGQVTTRVLLAYLPELGQGDAKQLAGLCGLAPYARESGRWKGKRTIRGGRARVRTALYLAALVGSRHNPVIKAFYQRLLGAGKIKKLALVACARKLLGILHTMLKNQTPWREQKIAFPS